MFIYINIFIYIIYYLKSNNISFFHLTYILIPINITIKHTLHNENRDYYITLHYLSYGVPIIFIKIISTTLLYILLNEIFLLSTPYESIILNFLYLFKNMQVDYSKISYLTLTTLLTSQFLEKSIYNAYIFYSAIKLKYFTFIKLSDYLMVIYIILYSYIKYMKDSIDKLAYNAWNRRQLSHLLLIHDKL